MSIAKSFFTVSSLTLVSRILGFVRDMLMAYKIGTGPVVDAFLVAFKLPNFFRRLFAEGAFTAAFVPMFTGKMAEKGKEEALIFGSQIYTLLFAFLLCFTLLAIIAMPYVMLVLAPGFNDDPEQFDLAVHLSRITFPYLLFISLVSLMSGVLNSFKHFAVMASAPILLNLTLIAALLWLSDYAESEVHALAIGVFIAGVLQFLWLWSATRRLGAKLRLVKPTRTLELKQFWRRFLPGVVGAGVVQINIMIDVIIGTFIPSAIGYLYYADRLYQLPLSLIGTAMGVALLPSLSDSLKRGHTEQAHRDKNRSLFIAMFFALPSAAALIAIGEPIISVLFERGEFDATATRATYFALAAYAAGLPAFILIKILTTGYFARGDTKTPVIIAIKCLAVNLIGNLSFVWLLSRMGFMPHMGLALATSLSAWVNVTLLMHGLATRYGFGFENGFLGRMLKVMVAVMVMTVVLLLAQPYLFAILGKIAGLVVLVACGAGSFFLSSQALGLYSVRGLLNAVRSTTA